MGIVASGNVFLAVFEVRKPLVLKYIKSLAQNDAFSFLGLFGGGSIFCASYSECSAFTRKEAKVYAANRGYAHPRASSACGA